MRWSEGEMRESVRERWREGERDEGGRESMRKGGKEREKRRTEGFWERQAKRGMGGVTDTGSHSCGKLLRKGSRPIFSLGERENERLFTGSG